MQQKGVSDMNQKPSAVRSITRRISGVTMPIGRKRMRWLRNWLCLCGSAKKYKNCCMAAMEKLTSSDGNMTIESLPEEVQIVIDAHHEAKGKGGVGKNG